MQVHIQSETFTREDGAWVSEGVQRSHAPCRFFYKKNGDFALSYDEESEGCRTVTRLSYEREENRLTLACTGDRRYTAVFGGEECAFVYAVSAFAFDAVARTESLTVNINEAGGALDLAYQLTLSDLPRRILLSVRLA